MPPVPPIHDREMADWHQFIDGCRYEPAARSSLHDILDAVDRFAQAEVPTATAQRWDRAGVTLDAARHRAVLPAGLGETLAKLRELGYFGVNLGEEFGGLALPALAETLIVERLSRQDPALALFLAVHYTATTMIRTFGDEPQKTELLPAMSGSGARFLLGGLAYTEPGAGSSLGEAQCEARPAQSARPAGPATLGGAETGPALSAPVALHGEKIFISSGGVADLYIVLAREPGAELSTWLCRPYDDAGQARSGFSIAKLEEKIRLHASPTAHLRFDGLPLPAGSRLGAAGRGLSNALVGLNSGRLGIAAQALGIAAAAFAEAYEYITSRRQFGRPVASFQSVRFQMAELYGRIAAGRSLLLQAVQLKERGERFRAMASIAKLHCSELAAAITPICLQFCGGMGFMDEMSLGRHLGNAQVTTIYEGTSNMQKLTLAKELFGD
ncbi:MAG: acyl-CoA dehydrogenase family protein [Planctomycetota bacterium]